MNIILCYCYCCKRDRAYDESLWLKPWWKFGIVKECCCYIVCNDCVFDMNLDNIYCPICHEKFNDN